MRLFTIAILFCTILSCKNKSETDSELKTDTTTKDITLDATQIANQLDTSVISKHIKTDKDTIILPFQYSLDFGGGIYKFSWQLCDLMIDSDSLNYSHYSLKNNIPYKGFSSFEGNIHLVNTLDSNAVTTQKFKHSNKEFYKKIYYADDESIICKTSRNVIAVLSFKYLRDKKSFAIFFKENHTVGFEASEEELIDLAISQLRLAKNIFKEYTPKDLHDWNTYKNSLSQLESKVYKKIFTKFNTSLDSIGKDAVFTPRTDGNQALISTIKLGNEGTKLWQEISKLTNKNITNFSFSGNTELFEQIGFLLSRINTMQVEFINDDAIILKKKDEYSKQTEYIVMNRQVINNNDILFFTGSNYNYDSIFSKEMAYFYLNLFNNYNDL